MLRRGNQTQSNILLDVITTNEIDPIRFNAEAAFNAETGTLTEISAELMRERPRLEVGQLWFNFDDFEAPKICKPQTDKERFIALQARFLAGDQSAREQAWILCDNVADKLISKEFQKKGVPDILNRRADIKHDMLCQLFGKYERNAAYRVRRSIVSVLYDCMRNVLYHPHKLDKLLSYCDDIELIQLMRSKDNE